ncbi:thiolase family protein [Microbacterium sp. MM2322]|uniref:thiolase family protein n=1 Tax=Microbacterium sp. MM2322 TaxID=3157631 RepID=UPI0032D58808
MTRIDRDPVIIAARRSHIGTRGRALAGATAGELAAPVVRQTLRDARRVATAEIEMADVLLGNCMGPGGNLGRIAALGAGLGFSVPGGTVDRQCGSGLAAIADAAAAIRAGDERARIAGGVESASTAPTRSTDGRPYARAPFAPRGFADPDMVQAAEDLAIHRGISRRRQDAHAARSHARARALRASGGFDSEIVSVLGSVEDDAIGVADTVRERLPPVFPGGTVTAGNTARISDGAATVLLVPPGQGPGLAVRATAIVGCDPAIPGVGAAAAVQEVLSARGLETKDVDAFEIVEAFAVQSLAVLDLLHIGEDDSRVCAGGGALAYGHPWGASGAVAVVRLFSRLVRGGAPSSTYGVAAASVGGGLGVAALFHVVR